MPLFGKRPTPPTDDELRAAEVDLERIRQGGIPAGAEERLKRLSNASTPFFTSDLSAKEYALAQLGGLQPIAQVMGSSVVQQGWGRQGMYYWTTGEVPQLSEPWNLARERAFDRMRQEAQLAAADGVIGIEINTGVLPEPGMVELVVFGTAVRDTKLRRDARDPLGMCTLSGQEVDKLHRIGAEVVGVVGYTTVIAVQLGMNSMWVMNSGRVMGGGGSRMNVEIREIAQGVYMARRRVMAEVMRQGSEVGANDIVISTLNHSIQHREYEQTGYTNHYFYVTMSVLGTAIRLGARQPYPEPLADPLMSINLGSP